ncbi:MAG: DUF4124 domain-containing protein [Leucothrix sp.]
MIKQILLSFFVTFSLSQTLHANIYKWTDSDGKVHYSATPPKDTKTKAEDIADKIKFNIGKLQPTTKHHTVAKIKPKAKTPKERKEIKTAQADYKNDQSKARLAYCSGLKRNIHTLETSKNVNIAEKGNLKPLSGSEKAARLEKEKSNLEKNCAGL